MTLCIMALSIKISSVVPLSLRAFSKLTVSIKSLISFSTQHNATQQNDTLI